MRPKVACRLLLEKMQAASITEAFVVLREGKWDIRLICGDGEMLEMNLAYLIIDAPFGVPFTMTQALPFIQEVTIAFGFPVIFFEQDHVCVKLLNTIEAPRL